jgi:hypothetical protein
MSGDARVRLIFSLATGAASVAFQLSLAIWPDKLQHYAWAVKYVWMFCAALWVLLLLSYLFTRDGIDSRGANLPSGLAPPGITVNVSPTISATFSAGQSSAPENRPQPPAATAAVATDDISNLLCIKGEIASVAEGAFCLEKVSLTDAVDAGDPAAVVTIANDPIGNKTTTEADVRASIVFLDKQGNERRRVSSGCWRGVYQQGTTFRAGDVHELFLIGRDHRYGLCSFANPRRFNPFREGRWGGAEFTPLDPIALEDTDYLIQVQLLGTDGRLLRTITLDCRTEESNCLKIALLRQQ